MIFKKNKDNSSSLSLIKVVNQEDYSLDSKKGCFGKHLKKVFLIVGLIFILWSVKKDKTNYIPEISINQQYTIGTYFATYSLGKVYICSEEDFESVCSSVQEEDIVVIDKTGSSNPDMCIYNSCEIRDCNVIMEVLLILQEYARLYPSDWNRTFESMYNEWIVHNICYSFGIELERTTHVDLDNNDENMFSSPILTKIFDSERR